MSNKAIVIGDRFQIVNGGWQEFTAERAVETIDWLRQQIAKRKAGRKSAAAARDIEIWNTLIDKLADGLRGLGKPYDFRRPL